MRCLLPLLLILAVTPLAHAQTIWYVDDEGETENGCTSWDDACPELQIALSLADPGDQIWVAVGTYRPDYDMPAGEHTGDREATFQLVSGIEIYGGFDATEETLEDRAGLFDETILSGDLSENDAPNESSCCRLHLEPGCDESACAAAVCDIFPECCQNFWYFTCATVAADLCTGVCGGNEENSYHVVTALGTDAETAIDGFAVTGGNASAAPGNDDGGGLLGGGLTVRNCSFLRNRANEGGGLYAHAATVTDCSFERNWSSRGGGMRLGGAGAVSGCVFRENSASLRGGGIYLQSAQVDFSNCAFIGNGASADGGGGMYASGLDATMTDCEIRDNFSLAHSGGGILCIGDLIMNRCSFIGNTTFNCCGGGMFLWHGNDSLIMNSIFVGNSADWGGALSLVESDASVINCTIVGNTATTGTGGGIFDQVSGHPTVANCILWDNSPNQIYDLGESVETQVYYSDVDGGWFGAGSDNMNAEPLFTNVEKGDYHLLPGSPCIDAADNFRVPAEITTDLDANPRFVDDPDTEDTGPGECLVVDVGAYEYQEGTTVCCPADLDGNGSVGAFDLALLLGNWGPCPEPCMPGDPAETCPADLSGDCNVSALDLALLLGNWGECE